MQTREPPTDTDVEVERDDTVDPKPTVTVAVSDSDLDPDPESRLPVGLWAKVRHLVVHRVLRLDDTPHRISFGVFLGFVVGASPTIGFQMIIYVAVATLLRANKVSGLLPVWLSNPLTAVPLYYSNWKIGQFLLTGSFAGSTASKDAIARLFAPSAESVGLLDRLASRHLWTAALDAFLAMGAELWLGSLVVGLVCGVVGYWATFRAVVAYRAAAARRGSSKN